MDRNERFKGMSARDFAALGVDVVAFVRPVVVDEQTGFALCAADGRPIAIAPNHETAIETAIENELVLVPLH